MLLTMLSRHGGFPLQSVTLFKQLPCMSMRTRLWSKKNYKEPKGA